MSSNSKGARENQRMKREEGPKKRDKSKSTTKERRKFY